MQHIIRENRYTYCIKLASWLQGYISKEEQKYFKKATKQKPQKIQSRMVKKVS